MLPFTAWATRERDVKLILRVPHLLLVGLAIALSACSGGGPATAALPNAQMASAATYTGPAPATADVQAFKVNLWQYIDTPDRGTTRPVVRHRNSRVPTTSTLPTTRPSRSSIWRSPTSR